MNNYKNRLTDLRSDIFVNQRSLPAFRKVEFFSDGIDAMLSEAFALHAQENGLDIHACLVALGGYGRRELCPFSDIDLLVLHTSNSNKESIASAVRFFWDMGLTLGCVVRNISECKKILGEDLATDTALLQTRYIAGNKRLFSQLENSVVRPFFDRTKNRFLSEIRRAVSGGIFSSDNSLYRTEPDIKGGICTLRDCQRIMWAERVIAGVRTVGDLHRVSAFPRDDSIAFANAYEFLLNVRCELHILCDKRIDTLESELQPGIAAAMGFGDNGAGALMESFFKTVRTVKYFALRFLEKRNSSRTLWGTLRSAVSATNVSDWLMVLDGILVPRKKQFPANAPDAPTLLKIFRIAQIYQATFGVELVNYVRTSMQSLSLQDFRTPEVDAVFLEILAQDKDSGRILGIMHETGVLAGLVPAFASLVCKVEYETNHEFTVDQHILLAMQGLDNLGADQDPNIRGIFQTLDDKLLLRLATLLHDIGKSMPGDHVTTGTIIAEEMCDRLGLSPDQKRRVSVLVYNHLELSTLAFGRELESHLVDDLAGRVGDAQTLNMLYLLTVLDIRHVGYGTWTGWRATLLWEAFQRVSAALSDPNRKHQAIADSRDSDIDSPFYLLDTMTEERSRHAQWLDDLNKGDFTVRLDTFTGFDSLCVLCYDRLGIFADITGCISSEGYNILSARAYSTPSGKILDIFHLEHDGATTTPSEKRVENIQKKWRLLENGQATTESLLADRIKLYPPKKERGMQKDPIVRVNNGLSNRFTVLEIEAQDRFGLLFRIARCLSALGVNIVSARLSTRVDRAVDTFYVNSSENAKILETGTIDKLTAELLRVMARE